MRVSKAEVKRVLADRDWWRLLEPIFDARLHGFTDRHHASFIRKTGTVLELSGADHAAVMRAVRGGEEG